MIPVQKIDYIESQDDDVAVKCGGRSYLKEQPLGELEAVLDPAGFVRIHRRYVLNLARLARIEMGVTDNRIAVLSDGTQLPISRSGCPPPAEVALRYEEPKKEPGADVLSSGPLALSALEIVGYACSPLGATDVRPQSSHWR